MCRRLHSHPLSSVVWPFPPVGVSIIQYHHHLPRGSCGSSDFLLGPASADHWSDPPSKTPIRSVADMCLVDHWSDSYPWEKGPTTRANQQCSHEHVRRACAAAVDHWSNILSHYDNIKVRLGWAKTSRWYLDKSDANLQWTVWIRERERGLLARAGSGSHFVETS